MVNKVVLMIDMVESVLHMERDELAAVTRWHQFSIEASSLIANAGGHVVKSLGDGLMAVFDDALQAVVTAQLLHVHCVYPGPAQSEVCPLQLRIGLNAAVVYVGQTDIYGKGVNLTARLVTLANPGETVAGATVKDLLKGQPEIQFDDIGECYLKHLPQPVRAFRLKTIRVSSGFCTPLHSLPSAAEVRPFRHRQSRVETHSWPERQWPSGLVAET